MNLVANGFKTVKFTWSQNATSYIVSKYLVHVNDQSFEISNDRMESCMLNLFYRFQVTTFFTFILFLPDHIEPQYYEEPLQGQTSNTSFEECQNLCFQNFTCIQFIHFQTNLTTSININENSCYLLSSYNIFNASLKHPGAQIRAVKSTFCVFLPSSNACFFKQSFIWF